MSDPPACGRDGRRYDKGWYCLAFLDELQQGLTPVDLGRRLMLLRQGDTVRTYAADCPHRGAHLVQGRLSPAGDGQGTGAVVCPYHGYTIGLGGNGPFSTPELHTMVVGGAVYVRLSAAMDHGWPALLARLSETFTLSPGITLHLSAPMEEVIENGFDQRHFAAVHRLGVRPFEVAAMPGGALGVTSRFEVPSGKGRAVDYRATAIGPGLILVQIGGDEPYGVITGAVPAGRCGATARLSFLLPRHLSDAERVRRHDALKRYSQKGLDDDDAVWRGVNRDVPAAWTEDDAPVRRFYAFCDAFRPAS